MLILTASVFITILITCAVVFLTCRAGFAVSRTGGLLPCHIQALLEKTSAVYEYSIFIAFTLIGLSNISPAFRLSNHSVVSLDMVSLMSALIIFMFHVLKEPHHLICKSI